MKSKKILLLAPAFLLAGCLTNCKGGSTSTEVNVLAVSGLESNYYVGDKLDTSKLVVNSIDKDGKATAVAAENLEYSFTDAFTEVGNKTITVKDKKTNAKGAFVVTVLNASEVSKEKYDSNIADCFYKKNLKFDIENTVYTWNDQTGKYDERKYNSTYKRFDGVQELLTVDGNSSYLYHETNQEIIEAIDYAEYLFVYPAKNSSGGIDWIYNNSYNMLPGETVKTVSLFESRLKDTFTNICVFDNLTYKDGVYNYVKNIDNVYYSGEPGYINYSLTFNKGKLSKIESKTVETPKESNGEEIPLAKTITNVDFTYNEKIFTAPGSIENRLQIVSAESSTTEESTYHKITFSNFKDLKGEAVTDFTYLQKENLSLLGSYNDGTNVEVDSIEIVGDTNKSIEVKISNEKWDAGGGLYYLVLYLCDFYIADGV